MNYGIFLYSTMAAFLGKKNAATMAQQARHQHAYQGHR
jgi:hypothetical protein